MKIKIFVYFILFMLCIANLIPNISANQIKSFKKLNEENPIEYWAVISGVIDYEGPYNLPVNKNPAYFMYESLCELPNWKESNIQLLVDADATMENIIGLDGKTGLGWLIENSDDNDIVIFYFSGHGSQIDDLDGDESDGKDEIIAPYDIKKEGEGFNKKITNYISDDTLNEKLSSINCEGMCLIFDSCYCNGLLGGKNDIDKGPNRVIMTSSNKEWGLPTLVSNGDCFAKRVSDSLNGDLINEQGYLSAEEVYKNADKSWRRSVWPYFSLMFYYAYIKSLKDNLLGLIFVYIGFGGLPRPWNFPAMFDNYEGELILVE